MTLGTHVLGVDVGSTNTKVVLVRVGALPGTDGLPVTQPVTHPVTLPVSEQVVRSAPTPRHPDALLRTVLGLVRTVLAGQPAPVAVGVASMAETGVPLDARGDPLTELLRWDAGSDGSDAARVADRLGARELFEATGVRVSAKVPLVTWARLRRTRPDLWRRVSRWAGAADLVTLALTGHLVTDHTLAGRTMAFALPPAGLPLAEAFDAGLLGEVGLRPEQLPRVAAPGAAAGTVVDARFVAAGIPAGTPVVVAGHDHAVGTWAAGVREPGDRGDSLGTAEAVVTVVDRPVDRAEVAAQGMSLVRTAEGRHEAILGGSPAAGGMVAWWLDTVLPGRTPEEVFVGGVPEEPAELVVLPYPHGRQSPVPDPTARVRVLDAAAVDRSAELLTAAPGGRVTAGDRRAGAAVLEGLAHQAQWMLDVQGRLAGRPDEVSDHEGTGAPVRVLAGAAGGNPLWMGLKAAVAPTPLHLVTAAEPVATGAALLAAERLEFVPRGSVRLGARVVARPPGPPETWRRATDRFVALATGGVGGAGRGSH